LALIALSISKRDAEVTLKQSRANVVKYFYGARH